MKEQVVSFELAKKLKELGFDWGTNYYWVNNYLGLPAQKWKLFDKTQDYAGVEEIAVPTLSLAQKWFREERGLLILVDVDCNYDEGYFYWCNIYDTREVGHFMKEYNPTKDFYNYEEALEAGLLKACEIIKKK